MDKEKIRELQTMLDDARADCSKVFDYIKRLDSTLVVAREFASRIEERSLSAIGSCVDACNELEKLLNTEKAAHE